MANFVKVLDRYDSTILQFHVQFSPEVDSKHVSLISSYDLISSKVWRIKFTLFHSDERTNAGTLSSRSVLSLRWNDPLLCGWNSARGNTMLYLFRESPEINYVITK